MASFDDHRPGGSGILPEETPPKFFARHFSAYNFALPYAKDKDVLEIGFGDGYGADFLAGYARSVKAVDVLEKNRELASAKYRRPNLEFLRMSASDLGFEDAAFDAVLSFQVIEHIEEDRLEAYLGEIKRVLRKGGTALLSTLNLQKNRKPNRPYIKNPFHVKEFTYRELDSLIKNTFSEYEIQGLFYGKRLRLYERLKKSGVFRIFPRPVNIVDRFYDNITVDEFVWKKEGLDECIDFMAVCSKT